MPQDNRINHRILPAARPRGLPKTQDFRLDHAPGLGLGQPMMGRTVSRVVASRHAGFHPGELARGNAGRQDYALADAAGLVALDGLAQPSQEVSR